jgi:hypothetical protein
MAPTSGSLRQRVAFRSAIARLPSHSAWLHAGTLLGQRWLGGRGAKWITTQCEYARLALVRLRTLPVASIASNLILIAHDVVGSADLKWVLLSGNLANARICALLPIWLSVSISLAPAWGLATLRQIFARRSHGGSFARAGDQTWALEHLRS